MNRRWHGLMAACSGIALLVLSGGGLPEPAHAQLGIFIPRIGGFNFYGGGRGCRHCRGGRHSGDDDAGNDDSGSRKDRNDRTTSLAPPPSSVQNTLLRKVAELNPDQVTGMDAATSKSISPWAKPSPRRASAIGPKKSKRSSTEFQQHQNREGRGVTTPGDVTEHAIEQSLENAMRNAKLNTFENFLGENWTNERLRSMVLELVSADLDSFFNGNSRGYAPMQDVDKLIQRSALAVYRRIFELSELMAANRGSALFVQRLYQTHGAHADDKLREDAADMISGAATLPISKYESALRQNENGYALRYRAERIVYDCLSDNVERISSSETDIAEQGEIAQRVEETTKKECISWVENQFGTDSRALKPQAPMPLRAVWSATGPKDDPSMYGQAASELR